MLRKNYLVCLLVLLAGCKQGREMEIPYLPGLSPFKIDIQQGNVVTQEMIAKLQPGMTRNQVRFLLGTPLLVDPFRNDRWDYVYLLDQGGKRIEQRQLKIYFKDDKMVRYEGDLPMDKPVLDAAGKPVPKPAPQPVAAPAAKPDAVKPADVAPAAATTTPVPSVGDPQLRLSPTEGKPASPAERAAASASPSTPAASSANEPPTLEAPPLPRIQLPPEQPETPAAEKP